MTNQDVWKVYKEYTDSVSTILRRAGFACIAILWIMNGNTFPIKEALKQIFFFIVLFFIFDALQYIISALIYKAWIRKTEKVFYKKERTIEGDYQLSTSLDRSGFILWISKIVSIIIAYGAMIFQILFTTSNWM